MIDLGDQFSQQVDQLDPNIAQGLRGGIASFQKDHLPTIDRAQKAVASRDAYLDRLNGRMQRNVEGLSPLEMYLIGQLVSGGDGNGKV
jgi:hypothetical protein